MSDYSELVVGGKRLIENMDCIWIDDDCVNYAVVFVDFDRVRAKRYIGSLIGFGIIIDDNDIRPNPATPQIVCDFITDHIFEVDLGSIHTRVFICQVQEIEELTVRLDEIDSQDSLLPLANLHHINPALVPIS